jgi:DNA-binding transcriptional LysR family regulator
VINLQRLDLNLLRTLDVLLERKQRHPGGAAAELSQPSVSIQLARLREIFADPLLMPGRAACSPPPAPMNCADRCAMPCRRWSWRWRPPTVSTRRRRRRPGGWRRRTIWPRRSCCRRCTRCVGPPGSRLAVFELQPARLVQQAERDEVDLFFHTRDGAPPGLHQRLLFSERYVLAGRAGHPALRRR